MAILGVLFLGACIVFGLTAGIAFWLMSTNTNTVAQSPATAILKNDTPIPLSTPTPLPIPTQNTDPETAQRIKRAFLTKGSGYPSHTFVIFVAGGETANWIVETRDSKKEVWVIGVEEEIIDANGKRTEIIDIAYYDLPTQRLTYAPVGVQAIEAAGYGVPTDATMPLD